ncbi:MAG TPA: Asp23/Gls24 family envelope stress response protein [Gaiellaceae bacterium]|nr:Asp23/Gls24 family envelope stress response protein [Gaiellaceae bacterium]
MEGSVSISSDAIVHIVGETARECYGVVGMGGLKWLPERIKRGIDIRRDADGGVTIELHVVVAYGLNLAEVASTIRNRVGYEVERLTGLPVRSVEVHIEGVRNTA